MPEENGRPACESIKVVAFRGNRSRRFAAWFLSRLAEEKRGGRGPTRLDCLLYAGHTGVSIDGGITIYGFNPDSDLQIWRLMELLKLGQGFPGVVLDDTHIFGVANARGLQSWSFEIIVPRPVFHAFGRKLDDERKASHYHYGFPNGDGDCNCTTWLERLGLPLLTGRMDEFAALLGLASYPKRRFGQCV